MRSHDTSPAEAGDRPRQAVPSPPSAPADVLARQVAAALPGAPSDLAETLAAHVRDPACYEASVRGSADSRPTAGRMMIEQASGDVLDAIASALDVALPPAAFRWLELADRERVPIIAGWDLCGGGVRRCVKLYVNASDASHATRDRLRAALAPDVALGDAVPAVLGMNARADGVIESKLYVQSADAPASAKGFGEQARDLAATARDEGADAGGVLSFDAVGRDLRARAFFVALREPRDDEGWRCIRTLPGYDSRAVESLLPFPPAPPRSVGISLQSSAPSPLAWTLYFKPRASGRAPETLEPAAIFRGAGVEVGVFVEPNEYAARAFRRTERHAVSVRVRDGNPSPGALEALVDWFTAGLRASERDGARLAAHLIDPPTPWRIVGAMRSPGDARERA